MAYASTDARIHFRPRGRGSPLFLIGPRPVARDTWHPLLCERLWRSHTLTHTGHLRYLRTLVTPAELGVMARSTWTSQSCAARCIQVPRSEIVNGTYNQVIDKWSNHRAILSP
jgi:hypothetical protein